MRNWQRVELDAVRRSYASRSSFLLEKDVVVHLIDQPDVVGYTIPARVVGRKPRIDITLSYSSESFDKHDVDVEEPTKETVMFWMLGVLAHETMHQFFTAFSYEQAKLSTLPRQMQGLAHTVFNIVEDPAIEYAAATKCGGVMLRALYAFIHRCWVIAPDIDAGIPKELADQVAFQQVLNAMIQVGDQGVVKGKFLSKQAEEAFYDILPIFRKAIVEPNPNKRVDMSLEIFERLKPLIPEQPMTPQLCGMPGMNPNDTDPDLSQQVGSGHSTETTEVDPNSPLGKALKRLKRLENDEKSKSKSKGDDDENGDGEGSDGSEDGKDGDAPDDKDPTGNGDNGEGDETDGKGGSKSPKSKSKGDKGEGADGKGEQSDADGNDADGKSDQSKSKDDDESDEVGHGYREDDEELPDPQPEDFAPTEDDLNELERTVQTEIDRIVQEEKEEAEIEAGRSLEEQSLSDNVVNVRASDGCEEEYAAIVARQKSKIEVLKRTLLNLFRNDHAVKTYSNHGSRLAINRLCDGKVHSDVMVKRKDPRHLDNMAVYLLVDCSGSMTARNFNGETNSYVALQTAIALYEAFTGAGIPVAVTGFTSAGNADGYASHIQYTTWHASRRDKVSMTTIRGYANNYDFWSIDEATKELMKHGAKHKFLIVLSDGAPCPVNDMNCDAAIKATANAVKESSAKGVHVVGVALNCRKPTDYEKMYGTKYISCKTSDDVFLPISKILQEKIR